MLASFCFSTLSGLKQQSSLLTVLQCGSLGWGQLGSSPRLCWAHSCVCSQLLGWLGLADLRWPQRCGFSLLQMVSYLIMACLPGGWTGSSKRVSESLGLQPARPPFHCILLATAGHRANPESTEQQTPLLDGAAAKSHCRDLAAGRTVAIFANRKLIYDCYTTRSN